MNSHSGGSGAALAGSIAATVLIVGVVLLLIAAYFLVRSVNLVLAVLVRYPRSRRPLWLCLALFASVSFGAAFNPSALLLGCTAASYAIVLLVAHSIELRHAESFEEPASYGQLKDDVLHHWWTEVA